MKKTTIMTNLVKRAGFVVVSSALCVVAVAGTAFAYFTDYVYAAGSKTLDLEYQTEIHEEMDGLNKSIHMENTGNTEVFTRIQLFYGNADGVSAEVAPGEGWTRTSGEGDMPETWEYAKVLAPQGQPGNTTSDLTVNVTADHAIHDFDIIVIGQTSPVVYDGEEPQPSIWTTE